MNTKNLIFLAKKTRNLPRFKLYFYFDNCSIPGLTEEEAAQLVTVVTKPNENNVKIRDNQFRMCAVLTYRITKRQ